MAEDKGTDVAAKEGGNYEGADNRSVSVQGATRVSWSPRACGPHWTLLGPEFLLTLTSTAGGKRVQTAVSVLSSGRPARGRGVSRKISETTARPMSSLLLDRSSSSKCEVTRRPLVRNVAPVSEPFRGAIIQVWNCLGAKVRSID